MIRAEGLTIISVRYRKVQHLYSVVYRDSRGPYLCKYPEMALPSEERLFLRSAQHRNETPYEITWS